jgi:predicted nucleic acid-binding protein
MTTPVCYLADTSALIRLGHPEVAAVLAPLVQAGVVATCAVGDLDFLSRLPDPAELEAIRDSRALAFPWLTTHDDDLRRALAIQYLLADAGQVAPWPALVVAAVAERHQVAVLHYDRAFDQISRATGQPMAWVVPEGSLP